MAYLNELNAALLAAINVDGRVFLSHTEMDGRYCIRLAIGNIRTDWRHVEAAWQLAREHAARLDGLHG